MARWRALPAWARWPLLFLLALGVATGVGILTIGVGNAVFLAGALAILASLLFIRHGGRRKVVKARDIHGRPLVRDWMAPDERAREIHTGLALFLVGLALWGAAFAPVAYDELAGRAGCVDFLASRPDVATPTAAGEPLPLNATRVEQEAPALAALFDTALASGSAREEDRDVAQRYWRYLEDEATLQDAPWTQRVAWRGETLDVRLAPC